MACNLNYEQLRNALKNRQRFTVLPKDASAVDINELIRTVDSKFGLAEVNTEPKDKGDDLRRYTLLGDDNVFDTTSFINYRVTDASARKYRRNQLRFKTQEQLDAEQLDPNNIIKREFGTKVHDVLEKLGKYYYDIATTGNSTRSLTDIKTESVQGEYPINAIHFTALDKNAKRLVSEILDTQKAIDPNGKVEIHFERVFIDPVKDVGGTIDVLAVFSDKTAMIYDYKTFSSKGEFVSGTGNSKKIVSRNFAITSKKEAWKEQMSGYRRMLMSNYGITNVRATRIVPIWIDIETKFNTTTQQYTLMKKLNKLQMGTEMSEYLRNISIGIERKEIPFIDKFLTSYYERIDKLKKEYSKADKGEREKISNNIEVIEQAILDFVEKDQVTKLVGDALNVAIEANDLLDSGRPFDFGELNDSIDFISAVVNFVRSFEDMELELQKDNPSLASALRKAIDSLDTPITALAQINGRLIIERIDNVTGNIPDRFGTVQRAGQTITMGDDGYLRQLMLPSSEQNNPLVRYAVDRMQRSLSKTRGKLRTFDTDLAKVEQAAEQWLQSQGKTLYDLHEYLLDENHNLINPLSSDFYVDRNDARRNGNTDFFQQFYSIKEKNNFNETYDQWYARRSQEQKEFFEYYYRNLKNEDVAEFNKTILVKMDQWQQRNDLSLGADSKPKFPQAWLSSSFLEPNDNAKAQYKNEQFAAIENIPAVMDYYNFVRNFMEEYRPIVGYDVINSPNFFPKVRASIIEKLATNNFKGIGEDLRAILSIREDEMDFGVYDEATGAIEKTIPVFFTNPLNDKGQLSNDMGNSLRLFAKVVYNYEHMEEVEAEVLAVKEILTNNVQYHKSDSMGRQVFDKFHNVAIKSKSEGASLTEEVFNTYVDYYLYGVNMQVFNNNAKLTNNLMKAKNYFSLKTLAFGFVPGLASFLGARASSWVEGQKGLYYTKDQWHEGMKEQVTNNNKYNGISYFFGVQNNEMLEDIANSRGNSHTIIKDKRYTGKMQQYLNQRNLMRSFSLGDEWLDNHIAVAMAMNYGISAEGRLRKLENLPEGSKSIYEMFSINENAEVTFDTKNVEEVVYQFRNAVRKAQRKIKGTMTDEDTNYAQRHLITNLMMQFKTWMPGVLTERFGKLQYDDVLDSMEGGRYRILWSEMTNVEMEENAKTAMYFLRATGSALFKFSKLLLTNNKLSQMAGIEYQIDDKLLHSEFEALKVLNNDPHMTLADFRKLKESQLRAVVAELEVLLIFSSMLFALGADWDDDGKPLYKDMYLLHIAYKTLNRVKTEISFAYNPSEYSKLVTSPIPLSSLAVNAFKLISNTADEMGDVLFGEENKRFPIPFGGNRQGKNDPADKLHYTMSFIPAVYQMRKLLDMDYGPTDR